MDNFYFTFTFDCISFLRIQIRAIQRLAKSAEEFGEDKNLRKFKPEGAMEIRQAGNIYENEKKNK